MCATGSSHQDEAFGVALLSVMRRMESVVGIVAKISAKNFFYSASKRSASRADDDFKFRLQTDYGNPVDVQQLRCMLLNAKLPKSLVTGEVT
jgi:hypothetical protein